MPIPSPAYIGGKAEVGYYDVDNIQEFPRIAAQAGKVEEVRGIMEFDLFTLGTLNQDHKVVLHIEVDTAIYGQKTQSYGGLFGQQMLSDGVAENAPQQPDLDCIDIVAFVANGVEELNDYGQNPVSGYMHTFHPNDIVDDVYDWGGQDLNDFIRDHIQRTTLVDPGPPRRYLGIIFRLSDGLVDRNYGNGAVTFHNISLRVTGLFPG